MMGNIWSDKRMGELHAARIAASAEHGRKVREGELNVDNFTEDFEKNVLPAIKEYDDYVALKFMGVTMTPVERLTSVHGRIHRDSPMTGVIGDLEEYAKAMIGLPLVISPIFKESRIFADIEIGKIVSAEVDGDYVAWTADLYHGQTI